MKVKAQFGAVVVRRSTYHVYIPSPQWASASGMLIIGIDEPEIHIDRLRLNLPHLTHSHDTHQSDRTLVASWKGISLAL